MHEGPSTVCSTWPRSAYAAISAILLLGLASLQVVYTHTRRAYREVGFNDGRLAERQKIVDQLERNVSMLDCREAAGDLQPIAFVSVKTDAVYLVRLDGDRVQFCRDSASRGDERR